MSAKKEAGFEESMRRLEVIVREMEDGALKLDDLISRFEEGRQLLTVCEKKLNEVERKIELLVEKDGAETTEPFAAIDLDEPAPDDAPPPARPARRAAAEPPADELF